MAHRNSVSSVTGYTPFFLMYGRRGRLPLTRMLAAEGESQVKPFGTRLHDLSIAFEIARELTADSRKYNRERLRAKANAGEIEVGDTVMVAANEPLSMSAKWDPEYEVTRVVGTTCWVRHQTSGKQLKVHREKLRVVDPNAAWEDVRERPRRQRVRAQVVLPEVMVPRETLDVLPRVVGPSVGQRNVVPTAEVPTDVLPGMVGPSEEQRKVTPGAVVPRRGRRRRRGVSAQEGQAPESDGLEGAVTKMSKPDTNPIGQEAVMTQDSAPMGTAAEGSEPMDTSGVTQALDAEDVPMEVSIGPDVENVASRTRSKRGTLDWSFRGGKRGRR